MTDQTRDPRPLTSALTRSHPSALPPRTGLVGFSAFLPPAARPAAAPAAGIDRRRRIPAGHQPGPATLATSSAPQFRRPSSTSRTGRSTSTPTRTTPPSTRRSMTKAKYGTTVNYQQVINANDEFFGTIRRPRGGRRHWLGPRRAHRLDGRPAHPPQVGRADRREEHSAEGREHAGRLQGRQLRPDRRSPRAVAVRHDRSGLLQRRHRRADEPQRALDRRPRGRARSRSSTRCATRSA
jgi:hypothetical protein